MSTISSVNRPMIAYDDMIRILGRCPTPCQKVEEMEMPPLEELSLRFTGSHLADASGLGQMLGAEPLSQSLRSVQLWFSNLPWLSLREFHLFSPLSFDMF